MIYTTNNHQEAMYLKGLLENENIYVVVMSKRTQPYLNNPLTNNFEIYVHYDQAEAALDHIYNMPE